MHFPQGQGLGLALVNAPSASQDLAQRRRLSGHRNAWIIQGTKELTGEQMKGQWKK